MYRRRIRRIKALAETNLNAVLIQYSKIVYAY